jgi:glycosyltransferase involved in cell wall biosynthesis
VLNPPVTPQARGTKDKIILNVGRFFAPEHGHCKKQLDLVRAMRALQWRGNVEGWTLHLVGGVSDADRPYLERVRSEAADLPVELHVDAPGAEVRDLYSRASVYWHATGLGEDPETQPDRFEHFGITTVEAMSAGAVPVVIRAAGQKEVVEHGVSGLTWEPLVQLVCFTEDLILDPDRMATMSRAAEVRSERYGMPAFAGHLRGIVAELTAQAGHAGAPAR